MTNRECKNCGESDWTQFYEDELENGSERTETRYECEGCGNEGRAFDHGSVTVFAGGMRE